eukprot:1753906-Rhodomonas_salina.1
MDCQVSHCLSTPFLRCKRSGLGFSRRKILGPSAVHLGPSKLLEGAYCGVLKLIKPASVGFG